MKVVILVNGEIKDYDIVKNLCDSSDHIVCCDGGLKHAFYMGLLPDMVVGDMDSAYNYQIEHYRKEYVTFRTYPSEKDATDLELSIDYAIEAGASEIMILGGTGGRLDHTLGNIHALVRSLESGVKAFLRDETTELTVINKNLEILDKKGKTLSLLPFSEKVTGIVTDGLYYPLDGETLAVGTSRGISNIINSEKASITIESGYLTVVVALQN